MTLETPRQHSMSESTDYADGPRYSGLRARPHYRFSTKHPEHPRESGCSYPAMGPSPNPNAIHTCAAGRSTNSLPTPPCWNRSSQNLNICKAPKLCKAAKFWCKLKKFKLLLLYNDMRQKSLVVIDFRFELLL